MVEGIEAAARPQRDLFTILNNLKMLNKILFTNSDNLCCLFFFWGFIITDLVSITFPVYRNPVTNHKTHTDKHEKKKSKTKIAATTTIIHNKIN